MLSGEKKKVANEFGRYAEELAVREYVKKGYAILERNWRLGKTEIDIIAQKEDRIVMIEVKARSGKDEDPLSAVTPDKRRRMIKAADVYLRGLQGDHYYRFDIVTVTGNQESNSLEIYEEAFLSADLF